MTTTPLGLVDEGAVRIRAARTLPRVESEAQPRRALASLSGVDAVGVQARAAKLATRSIKRVLRPRAVPGSTTAARRLRAFVETATVWHTVGQ